MVPSFPSLTSSQRVITSYSECAMIWANIEYAAYSSSFGYRWMRLPQNEVFHCPLSEDSNHAQGRIQLDSKWVRTCICSCCRCCCCCCRLLCCYWWIFCSCCLLQLPQSFLSAQPAATLLLSGCTTAAVAAGATAAVAASCENCIGIQLCCQVEESALYKYFCRATKDPQRLREAAARGRRVGRKPENGRRARRKAVKANRTEKNAMNARKS